MIKVLHLKFRRIPYCETASVYSILQPSHYSAASYLNHHLVSINVALTADDLPKQFFGSVSKKRYAAHKELVKDDAHGPPVHWLPIALP